MVKIQFTVKNASIQKYTLLSTVICLVMTFMNMMNRIHYVGAIYAIGAILMGITNHIHNSLSITGIGCILDIFNLFFRNYNSNWAPVRYFQFLKNILVIVYELMYMTMLHCYWQYTEATKIQPQTSWLKNQTILPFKLGQFGAGALTPSVSVPRSIQTTEPDAAMSSTTLKQETNVAVQNSNVETPELNEVTEPSQPLTKLNVTMPEANVASEPSAAIELKTPDSIETTELSAAVSKPTVSSTEPNEEALNSIEQTLDVIETKEPDENFTEHTDALVDLIAPLQESNSVTLDPNSQTQKSIVAMESKQISEPDKKAPKENVISTEHDKNASEDNVTLTKPSATLQEQSVSIPDPNGEKL
ncbi:uncharacterized protein LOC113557990 [Rhopalosiphum maidis]|uniref:uncharacterized protein LOC113557990 n=1 Tax=Rhopalosiphum maidis TaxID=43146 RepID=UPI000EFF446F|nr:uncharacterized protein LOC113557990 [Rhopalosiphum maidis]